MFVSGTALNGKRGRGKNFATVHETTQCHMTQSCFKAAGYSEAKGPERGRFLPCSAWIFMQTIFLAQIIKGWLLTTTIFTSLLLHLN